MKITGLLLALLTTGCMITTHMGAYDDAPPTTPKILNNSDFSSKAHYGMDTTPEISWDGSFDEGLGLNHYEVSIGTQENQESGMKWTDVGNVTRASFSGNKLARDTIYRFFLRAVDKGGNYSAVVQSEPWTSEPLVTSYAPKSPGLNLNGAVKSRIVSSDGAEFLYGVFNRRSVYNLGCLAKMSPLAAIDTAYAGHTGISCLSVLKIIRPQTVNSEKYFVMVGNFSQVESTDITNGQLVRMKVTGELDKTFQANLGTGFSNGSIVDLVIMPDNKILVVGDFTTFNGSTVGRIVRLNEDGSLDSTFNVGTGFDAIINSAAAFGNGKVVLGGKFTRRNGVTISRFITILNTDGSIDSSFVAGTGFNYIDAVSNVSFVKIMPSGQILATGRFTNFNGTANQVCVTLLNITGTVDSTFSTNIASKFFSINLAKAYILSDGNYVFMGDLNQYSGQAIGGIVKINATTGAIDATFKANTNADISMSSITDAFVDGTKLVIMGSFTKVNNNTAFANIARLGVDGIADTTFAYSSTSGLNGYPYSGIVASDGSYYFGGLFTWYGGSATIGFVKNKSSAGFDAGFFSNVNTSYTSSFVNRIDQVDGDRLLAFGSTSATNRCFNFDGTTCVLSGGESKAGYYDLRLADGSYLVKGPVTISGVTIPFLGKVNSDGTLDAAFNAKTAGYSVSLGTFYFKVNKDKIYLYGSFTNINSRGVGGLYRLNMDGSEDLDFLNLIGSGFSSSGEGVSIMGLVFDSRGYAYISMYSMASTVNFKSAPINRLSRFVRLTPEFNFDEKFATSTAMVTSTYPIGNFKVMPDDRVFMWGDLTLNAAVKRSLVRFDKDGVFDSAFDQMTQISKISIFGVDFDSQDNLYIYGTGTFVVKGKRIAEQNYLILEANK